MIGEVDGVQQRMANRLARLQWRRWRRRVEVIHTLRMLRPAAYGWRWLYRDVQGGGCDGGD